MWHKSIILSQLFVALLLFFYNVMPTNATNLAQLKNQQQPLGQTAAAQHQHHPHHVSSQTQHQLQQQTHPANGVNSNANSVLHASNTGHHNTEAQDLPSTLPSSDSSTAAATSTFAHLLPPQYAVHDKEIAMQEILKHFNTDTNSNEQYHILKELKRETHENVNYAQLPPPPFLSLHSNSVTYPWRLYDRPYMPISLPPPQMADLFAHHFNAFETISTPFPVTPRFLPVMSYPQPVYIPYPFIMPPDMFYPSYSSLTQMGSDYEDSMSRGAGASRRPASSQHSTGFPRNSPIYYVRLPPTPYMFLPSLGLGSSTPPITSYPNIPYQSLPSFPAFSSVFNVPINFLANGKPTNIYQMSAPPNDVQNPLPFSNIPSDFNTRPPPPPLTNPYRPVVSSHHYLSSPASSLSSSSSNYASYPASSTGPESLASTSTIGLSQQDSKLTALKRPYFFNGRPEDIYILPNNFNPLYSSESSYY